MSRPDDAHQEVVQATPQRKRGHWPSPRSLALAALLLVLTAAEAPLPRAPAAAMQTQHVSAPESSSGETTLPEPRSFRASAKADGAVSVRTTPGPTIVLAGLVTSRHPVADVVVSTLASDGIPVVALRAYQHAADLANRAAVHCGLSWPLLAAIGRVESDHGRFAGEGLLASGLSTHRIIGVPLDGHGTAVVLDTDHGLLDGDPVYDRAVGPMQFIPSTWVGYATDGNGDGIADPFNIFDAAAAAAKYLCSAGQDLRSRIGTGRAVLTYNASDSYVASVLALAATYAGTPVTAEPASPSPVRSAPLPPVNPGVPTALPPKPSLPTAHGPKPRPTGKPSPEPALPTRRPVTPASPVAQPCQSTPATATASPSPAVPVGTPTPTVLDLTPSPSPSPAGPDPTSSPTAPMTPSSPPAPQTLSPTMTSTPLASDAPFPPGAEPTPNSFGCVSTFGP